MPIGGTNDFKRLGAGNPRRNALLLSNRVQAIRVDANNQSRCRYPLERRGHTTAPATDIVAQDRLRQHNVRVGIEAACKLIGVMIEIRLNCEPSTLMCRAGDKSFALALPLMPETSIELLRCPARGARGAPRETR